MIGKSQEFKIALEILFARRQYLTENKRFTTNELAIDDEITALDKAIMSVRTWLIQYENSINRQYFDDFITNIQLGLRMENKFSNQFGTQL